MQDFWPVGCQTSLELKKNRSRMVDNGLEQMRVGVMDGGKLFVLVTNLWVLFAAVSKKAAAIDVEPRRLAAVNPGLISIDCGSEEDYTDNFTGIAYKTDANFISTGRNYNLGVRGDYGPYIGQQLRTLRYFPGGRKNCYTLQPEAGKNHNYYLRVFFLYGNYDGLSMPPDFDLYLGVNRWVTVNVDIGYYGMVYFALTNSVDVCLVNTGNGIPFISTLELRPLENSAYRIESGLSLKPLLNCNLGSAINTTVRYKDDVYDRIWNPCSFPNWVSINTTADIDNKGTNDSYKLPVEVLRTAVQPGPGLNSLSYTYNRSSFAMYIYFHFSEVEKGKRREFTINLNGVEHGPYRLEYLKAMTLRPQESPIQDQIQFSINPTKASDAPPILNAFEIYFVHERGISPTSLTDVSAMEAIKQRYRIDREDWQGDPCLPRISLWSGLNCYIGNDSRIISLNLSSSKLTGEITSAISNLTAIQSLDMSNNELTGKVPEFLAQLPNLTVLNLTGNRLTFVPTSLLDKSERGLLQLRLDENLNPCREGSCSRKKNKVPVSIIASFVSICILGLLISIAAFWKMKRRVTATEESLKSSNQSIKYSEIVRITSNFKSILGEGGFGKVYLGGLKDGTQVAVKLLSESSKQGYKEFQAEVQILMNVHHRNLVSLMGYCSEHGKMALVYEYMANGNLRQYLLGKTTNVLDWRLRLQTAIDVATGLEYLHNGCKPPIIHRDLKPSNILLNENLQAKISDLGLSKVFRTEMDTHVTTHPAGTMAYLDPEFQRSGNLNKKCDVYSFGIVLFELITGRPVIIPGNEYNIHIVHWVVPLVENGDIQSILDPRLRGEFSNDSICKAVDVAKSCVSHTGIQRPDISQVLAELKECLAVENASRGMEMTNMDRNLENLCNSRDVCLELETDMAPSPR